MDDRMADSEMLGSIQEDGFNQGFEAGIQKCMEVTENVISEYVGKGASCMGGMKLIEKIRDILTQNPRIRGKR